MKPQFADTLAWQQAEFLMQPAYLRIVDHIRKKLEESVWKATYEEVQIPYPGYHLCLQHKDQQFLFDLWDLCFQVCFSNYSASHSDLETKQVEIDTSLIDYESEDVDWQRLDEKARQIVWQVFDSLPAI